MHDGVERCSDLLDDLNLFRTARAPGQIVDCNMYFQQPRRCNRWPQPLAATPAARGAARCCPCRSALIASCESSVPPPSAASSGRRSAGQKRPERRPSRLHFAKTGAPGSLAHPYRVPYHLSHHRTMRPGAAVILLAAAGAVLAGSAAAQGGPPKARPRLSDIPYIQCQASKGSKWLLETQRSGTLNSFADRGKTLLLPPAERPEAVPHHISPPLHRRSASCWPQPRGSRPRI